jgi:hypothetical protein
VDGKWVRGVPGGRCGLFASDWKKDIIDLAPGDSIRLEWYHWCFDLKGPQKVKVRAAYAYRATERDKDGKPDPGAMGKTPPFTLYSEPVEIELK